MKRGRRPPKRPTPERLKRRALAYLERFAASRAHLRKVLRRRALDEAAALGLDTTPVEVAIEALLGELERLGYIDDRRYAEARARRLAGKGMPPRRIATDLAARGVPGQLIEPALAELGEDGGEAELRTALAFARRRRLGPFAREQEKPPPDKALAAFARAGFSYSTARRILEATDPESLA